jgi:hypothetical protein
MLVVHISRKRFEKIRSQGYQVFGYYNMAYREGDAIYHIGDDCVDDVWFCCECQLLVQSVKVSTPAELMAEKLRMGGCDAHAN